MTWNRLIAVTAGALLLTAAPARADFFISPTFGVTTGGLVTNGARMTFGGQLGVLTDSMVGFEADYGYSAKVRDTQGTGNIRTFGGAVLIAPKRFGSDKARPYFAVGGGVINAVSENKHLWTLGDEDVETGGVLSVGGGVFGLLSNHFGVRGDVRYFHAMLEKDDFDTTTPHFFRISGGLVVKF